MRLLEATMSEWFMPTKLAGLPGLPTTDRGIRKLAEREGWKKQKHSGRGGGY
ncbi:DNA-binding protein, partial [Pseudomonas aeruginosa]|uniref:DNA-binding protein n=1 Tax=Pseudomonas aeruginosa TaxID=287 RepID=UPI00289FEF21